MSHSPYYSAILREATLVFGCSFMRKSSRIPQIDRGAILAESPPSMQQS